MEPFLRATWFIDSDHPSIAGRSLSVTEGCKDEREKAVALFEFVRDGIAYNPYGPIREKERYTASATLERGYGYCIQKATLLAALLRAARIPAALIFADIRNVLIPATLKKTIGTDIFVCHCYNNILINGKWHKATPAFDSAMSSKLDVPVVRFDGRGDAVFPPTTADGRPFVTYLAQRGIRDDVPFDEIMEVFLGYYGEAALAAAEKGPERPL